MNTKKLRDLYIKFVAPFTSIKFAKSAVDVALEDSYYPECKMKSKCTRIIENIGWLIKNKEPNLFYNLYGLDLCTQRNQYDYLGTFPFCITRGDANKIKTPESQVCLLRDKLLFYEFMTFNHLPVPTVLAIVENRKVLDLQHNEKEDSFIRGLTDYFVKDQCGECASFVRHVEDYRQFESILPDLSGKYIIQSAIKQCEQLDRLNAHAINTIRMVTVQKNSEIVVFCVNLRIGTKNSKCVDNMAAGGIAVGINEDGTLKKDGYIKPGFAGGGRIWKHPDTNVLFEGFQIPHYADAVEMAKKAHRCFSGIHSIGWDIAICDTGPVFIEGNDNWEISGLQACNGPLKEKWRALLK